MRDAGALLMFVLGEPGYYGRFGFSAENAEGFDSPYAGPYLLATELQGGLPCGQRGLDDHAPRFAALEERDPCAPTQNGTKMCRARVGQSLYTPGVDRKIKRK